MSADDLARRVADELEIRNLVARLAQLADMDSDDLSAYVRLFDEDATWEMPGAPTRHGRADILEGGKQRRASGTQGPGTHTRHVITTLAVWVEGDRARSEAYYLFVGNTNGTPELRSIGHYNDTFRRTPDGWKMLRRVITPG